MKDLKLDGNHDLFIEDSDLVVEDTRIEVIGQSLEIRLQMFYGEWYSNNTLGLPYYEIILGQKSNMGLVLEVIKAEIEREPSIQTVQKIDAEVIDRGAIITFEAITTDQETINETVAIGA